jgi:RNA polymerase sigma-70 factor (ECF subfamily)
MRPGVIEGEIVLVVDRLHGEVWRPAYLVRIHAAGGLIDRIADYYACPWILDMVSEDAE